MPPLKVQYKYTHYI